MNTSRPLLIWVPLLVVGLHLSVPALGQSQLFSDTGESAETVRRQFLPKPVSDESFSGLKNHSPFSRNLNLSSSLILTGVARIEESMVATMFDVDTRETIVVSEKGNDRGWQLVEVTGDDSDIESLTAQIQVAGAELVSVRYHKAPPGRLGIQGVRVSTQIGDGTPGGGTGPHGGPDPRVLTPDQLADARNAAKNIREGFQADGYADRQTIPPDVVTKISKLSVSQRESINVKMFEYRNRGVGMSERIQIYNRLLDREVARR